MKQNIIVGALAFTISLPIAAFNFDTSLTEKWCKPILESKYNANNLYKKNKAGKSLYDSLQTRSVCGAFYGSSINDDQQCNNEPKRKSSYGFIKSGDLQHKSINFDTTNRNFVVVCLDNNTLAREAAKDQQQIQTLIANAKKEGYESIISFEGKDTNNFNTMQCFILQKKPAIFTPTNKTRKKYGANQILDFIDPTRNFSGKNLKDLCPNIPM